MQTPTDGCVSFCKSGFSPDPAVAKLPRTFRCAETLRPRLIVPLASSTEVSDWIFSAPLGNQPMTELPFSEIVTIAHHLRVGTIRSLLNRAALADVRDAETPPPTAVDANGRSGQRFEMVVQLMQDGMSRTSAVRGQDIYAVTAPMVIEAALRLSASAYQYSGALALAEAVDPVELLRALHGHALEVSGDALAGRTPDARTPSHVA